MILFHFFEIPAPGEFMLYRACDPGGHSDAVFIANSLERNFLRCCELYLGTVRPAFGSGGFEISADIDRPPWPVYVGFDAHLVGWHGYLLLLRVDKHLLYLLAVLKTAVHKEIQYVGNWNTDLFGELFCLWIFHASDSIANMFPVAGLNRFWYGIVFHNLTNSTI